MSGPFVLTAEVEGDIQLARSFSRYADDVKDLSPAFREIADDFREGERRQFESEGRYGAGGWKRLAPSTVETKSRLGYSGGILVRTGALMRGLTEKGGDHLEEIKPLEMRIGVRNRVARFHQWGTVNMPARPVIKLPEEQRRRWHKIIHRYLVREMKKEFAGLMKTERAGAAHLGSI